jgi:hypothetical protein
METSLSYFILHRRTEPVRFYVALRTTAPVDLIHRKLRGEYQLPPSQPLFWIGLHAIMNKRDRFDFAVDLLGGMLDD